MLDSWPIVKTIQVEENKFKTKNLFGPIQVSPRENYLLSLEVLTAGLSGAKGIKQILINKDYKGVCKHLKYLDTDCTFRQCNEKLENRFISSQTGSLMVVLRYDASVNHKCDCTNENSNCRNVDELSKLKKVAAAVRITLNPIGINNAINIFILDMN